VGRLDPLQLKLRPSFAPISLARSLSSLVPLRMVGWTPSTFSWIARHIFLFEILLCAKVSLLLRLLPSDFFDCGRRYHVLQEEEDQISILGGQTDDLDKRWEILLPSRRDRTRDPTRTPREKCYSKPSLWSHLAAK